MKPDTKWPKMTSEPLQQKRVEVMPSEIKKTETTVQPQKSPTLDAEVRCADCDAMIFVPITRPPSEQEKRCDYCFDVFLSKMAPA